MNYQPGKHLIATLRPATSDAIINNAGFNSLVNDLVTTYELRKLGEVYHDFFPAGFTAVICLSESHIAIHTWPEHQLINLDIYLSNFERNNDNTVEAIFKKITSFFDATVLSVQTITR